MLGIIEITGSTMADNNGGGAVAEEQAALAQRICRYINDHLGERLTLDVLSAEVHMSKYHLQRVFKQVMGITPRQYADARRLERLKAQLKDGDTVTAAVYEAGYGSSSRVYERAAAQLGMTPATYGKGGAGMEIRYTVVTCRLGYLLVGATDRGVCSVALGDTPGETVTALYQDYPNASITQATDGLGEWVAALLGYIDGSAPQLDLPLDIQATAFQRRVWEALRAIPPGETRSYGAIAAAVGVPQGARAVGNAVASNPVSIIIPCHRAVRGDGSIGKYRWGSQRKAALLELEEQG